MSHPSRNIAIIAGMLGAFGLAANSQAAPGDNGKGRGGCIDTLYGNATNARPSGHGVLPSQSPGPFLNIPPAPNEPPRNDRTRGPSVGDIQQLGHDAGFNGGETLELGCLLF